MDTRKLLEELENVIDSATEVPFSNKKMVDKDEIERLIDAINQSLPNELALSCACFTNSLSSVILAM